MVCLAQMHRILVRDLLLREDDVIGWIILAFVAGAVVGGLIATYMAGKEIAKIDKEMGKSGED
jgi:uncharacterized membrane protein YoaK (UPF0700 family)